MTTSCPRDRRHTWRHLRSDRRRPVGPGRRPQPPALRHPLGGLRAGLGRRRPVGHRRPAEHRLRVRAPDLVEAHDRVRRVPDARAGRRLPVAPRAARLLPRLRVDLRPDRRVRVRHRGRVGSAVGRRRLDGRVVRPGRHRRAAARGRAGRQRHPERAVGAAVRGLLRRRGAPHQRLQVAVGLRGQAGADHRRRQLRLRHRRRRGPPRRVGRHLGAPWLLLRAEVPLRQARRHAQPGPPAATADQAGDRLAGAQGLHRRPGEVRLPRARLQDLRVAPDREHADPAPPGSRRPGRPAGRRAARRRRGGLQGRHAHAVRRDRAGDRLPPALPVPEPGAAAVGGTRDRAGPLPQRLHAGGPEPLRARHDRGVRHRLAGPLRAGRAGRVPTSRRGRPTRPPRAALERRIAGPRPDLSGGYHYLGLERMSYYVNKDAYRGAVRTEIERLGQHPGATG